MFSSRALSRVVIANSTTFLRASHSATQSLVALTHASRSAASSAALSVAGIGLGLTLGLGLEAKKNVLEAKVVEDAERSIDYKNVKEAINKLLDDDDNLGPTLVRLAWHASGSYDKKTDTGGSEGATMRFSPEKDYGANAGLDIARDAMEKVKKMFPEITYADLWTLAGATAIEYMGGPKIGWRPGRRDKLEEEGCPPDGRLPDADKGTLKGTIQHVRDIFYRMGFDDREIVALVGAHALGRCHVSASGYTGPWTRAPTSFSNEYFRELLENTWTLKVWDGPDQFEDPTGDLMMLPADMALIWDKEFRKYVEMYAKDEDAFFRDFAHAFQKLEELGVKAFRAAPAQKAWYKFW